MLNKINVLGIPLYGKSIAEACDHIISVILSNSSKYNRCVSATGAHGLVYAQQSEEFNNVLKSFYLNLPDGMPGVWIGRLKGEKGMKRCYGPELFKKLMVKTAEHNIKHFLCGGKEGVADELRKNCASNFENRNVTGTYCPPFSGMTEDLWEQVASEINRAQADIVWIGLSTPKQELFAYQLRNYTKTHFIVTVGAAFDFHTGKIKMAPKWMQAISLEWFFRLMIEPKRLYKRYMTIVPLFTLYNVKEFAYFCAKKISKRN